jgi:MFS family permease
VTASIPVTDPPASLIRPIAGALLCQLVVGIARPAVSYRALELGADAFVIGLLVAAFAVVPLVTALSVGRLAGRIRHVGPVPLVGGLLLVAACALAALAGDLVWLGVASALLGFGNLIVLLGAQAWITRASSTARYDAGFGWLTAGMSVGQAIGPLIAGIVIGRSAPGEDLVAEAFWIAALFGMAVAGCFVARTTARVGSNAEPEAALSPLGILRRPGVLASMAVSVSLLTSIDILTAYLPVIGEHSGIKPEVVGALLAIRGIASAVPRFLMGPLTRRWPRDTLVVASTLGGAMTMAVLAVTDHLTVLVVVMLVGGFLVGIGQPLTMSLVALAVPREVRSEALALRLVGNRVAQVTIPVLAGGLAVVAGIGGVFWLQSVFLAGSTAWSVLGARRRRASADE